MLTKQCEECGGSFEASRATKKRCSSRCDNFAWARARRAPNSRTTGRCGRTACGREFIVRWSPHLYCSRSCAAIANNPKRARIKPPCPTCGADVSQGKHKSCSRSCAGKERTQALIRAWLAGDLDASNRGGSLAGWARTYLLTEADHACPLCSWATPNPVTGTAILTINHIDGNWKNNARKNLEVLCYNCHTLTPTFGALNKGSASGRRFY